MAYCSSSIDRNIFSPSDFLIKLDSNDVLRIVFNICWIKIASNEFEAIFIQQMLKSMRKTSLESDFIKKSEGEKIFRSMLDEQYAKLSAKSGSLGLGQMIYQQLKSNLEK